MTSITTAYDGFKHAKDIFQLLLDAKIDQKSKEKVSAAMRALTEAQDSLFSAQGVMFSLQDENKTLKEKISALKKWKASTEKYKLVETPGTAVVYKYEGEPSHFACPSCMNERRVSILQDRRVAAGIFDCTSPSCKAEYRIKQKSPSSKRSYVIR